MSDYDNSNRIALWFNDKRDRATSSHLRGSGETNAPVWADAWFSKDLPEADKSTLMDILQRYRAVTNKPFLSVSLKPKEAPPVAHPDAGCDFEGNDIPF